MALEISRCVIELIQREAATALPLEACGLLFGDGHRIDAAEPCQNVAARPEIAFEIDPAALIAAHRAERAGGRRILGCYHSHPSGDATPSRRDAAAAEPNGWLWMIVGDREVQTYRARRRGSLHGRFEPVELLIK